MPITNEYKQHLDNAYQKRSSNDRYGSLHEFRRASECDPSSAVAIQEMGYEYLALRLIDEAKSAFEKALELEPDHLGALIGLGHTFRCLQQLDDAEREFRRALTVNRNHAGANLGLGYTLKSRHDRFGALEAFRATVATDPLQMSAMSELVALLRELGQLKEAIEVQRQLITVQPGNSAQLLSFARLLLQNGDREEAQSQLQAVVIAEPANLNSRLELGHLLYEMNRLADAEEIFKSILSHSPDNISALNALGWVYRTLQQTRDATTCFNSILELNPNEIGALHALGLLAREQNDHAKALAYFRNAATIDHDNINIKIELGNCLQRLTQFEEAASEFERVLEIQPNSIAALMGLGYAQRDAGKTHHALHAFDTAGRIDNNDAGALIEAGHTLLRRGDHAGAEIRFRSSLARDPFSASGLIGLGHALRLLGRPSDAEITLRFAVENHPTNVGAAIALGHLLESLRRFDEAVEILDRIAEYHPDFADVLGALANIHRQRGDHDAALRCLRRALEADHSASRVADLAGELRELGRLDEADRVLSAALDANPLDLVTMMERGLLLRLRSEHEKALKAFHAVHIAHPGHAQALVELATEQWALGWLKEAEQTLGHALDVEPNQLHALLQLGELAMLRGDFDGAQRTFQRAIEAHPGNVWPRLNSARAHFETGDSAAAFALLRELRRSFQSNPEIDAVEVHMLRQQRHFKRARAVLEQASIATDASSFWLWTHRVQLEIAMANYDRAKSILAEMRAVSASELARTELLRGEIAEAEFDFDQAISCYHRAIEHTPVDAWARMDLARASLLNVDVGTARTALTAFAKLSTSYLVAKGQSLNISQNHVGQLLEDFELDRLALAKLTEARRMPIDAQLARLQQILGEHPGSTSAAIRTVIALRQASCFTRSASPNETSPDNPIPKHIVQYWDHDPSPDLVDLMTSWKDLNTDYHWRCFDHRDATRFLDQCFPSPVLRAYLRAKQPAQQADIFRLAYLTARGGVYADADDRCTASLSSFLNNGATFIAHQDGLGSIGNNFIAASAEHPVLRRALSLAVEALNRGDQDLIWLSTGPGLLTRAFALEWASGFDPSWLTRTHIFGLGELQRFVGVHCPVRYKQTARHWSRTCFARARE
jgi:tetratricopeptide (TPR) repeat protein